MMTASCLIFLHINRQLLSIIAGKKALRDIVKFLSLMRYQ